MQIDILDQIDVTLAVIQDPTQHNQLRFDPFGLGQDGDGPCPNGCDEDHSDDPDWNCATGHYGRLDGDNHCEDYRCCIQ